VELDELYVIAVPLLLDETLLDDDFALALDILSMFVEGPMFQYVSAEVHRIKILGRTFLSTAANRSR